MPRNSLRWSTLRDSVGNIAADTTLLLAASSFIQASEGKVDPRSDRAFDAVTTAFCNGAGLYLPLPKHRVEDIPIFLDLWRRHGMTEVPHLELTDSEFERVIKQLARAFAVFVDGMAADTARWIQFQFSSDIVANHLAGC